MIQLVFVLFFAHQSADFSLITNKIQYFVMTNE